MWSRINVLVLLMCGVCHLSLSPNAIGLFYWRFVSEHGIVMHAIALCTDYETHNKMQRQPCTLHMPQHGYRILSICCLQQNLQIVQLNAMTLKQIDKCVRKLYSLSLHLDTVKPHFSPSFFLWLLLIRTSACFFLPCVSCDCKLYPDLINCCWSCEAAKENGKFSFYGRDTCAHSLFVHGAGRMRWLSVSWR